jgi:hypothetical protein
VRKTVAQTVLIFTIPFLVALGRAVIGYGNADKVHRSAAAWTVWSTGIALMVAGSVFAVLMLRGREPRATGRNTVWWCGGLWAAGLVLALVYSSMLEPPVR